MQYDDQRQNLPPPYTTYGFDDDQYPNPHPQSQVQALHPGGPYYPDMSPKIQQVQMSGASLEGNTIGIPVNGDNA
jgi:hypothetical protein